jgi:hypothetical protein
MRTTPVDLVMREQLERLKRYVKAGQPEAR